MNRDLNKNGLIDMIEQQIQHASTSTISTFATVAKKASEIRDGANKCYFNKVNKCLVIKHGNTPMTDCLQFNAKNNNINNVNSIHFKDESSLAGVVDNLQVSLSEDEAKVKVPSVNLVSSMINDISPETIYGQLDEIATKTHDLSYNSTNQTTTINNNVQINGNISSSWLNDEFDKYALVGHNHDSIYAPLVHNHSTADITNWATATENFAKTNAANTFSSTQTINNLLNLNTSGSTGYNKILEMMGPNLSAGSTAYFRLGKDSNTGNVAAFGFEYAGSNSVNNCFKIWIGGYADLYRFYRDRAQFNKSLNVNGDLTTTGNITSPTITTINETLNGKANLQHQHEFADIYKQTTRTILNETTHEEEEITETKTLQQVLNEYEQAMTNAINQGLNTKANVSHTHEISNIYKNIVDEQGNQSQKSLETLINEKDSAIRTLINGKANSSHSHNATEITYKNNVNVKQELDNINQQLDINDSNGNKINILSVLFGVGAAAGAVIDGGLVAAVGTLQEEVALLQTQIAALGTAELTGDVLDAVNVAGEVVEGGASIWKGLKGIANAWKQMRTAAAGYVNLATEAAVPLMPL